MEITALGLLTSVPRARGTAVVWIALLSSGMGWPIVCLQIPGPAKGGAGGTLPPCVQTPSL